MSISEQIETIVQSLTDNNIPSQLVTIEESYTDLRCDVQTNNSKLKRVICSNVATKGKEALLIYLNGDPNQPFVLLFTDLRDYYTKEEIDDIITGTVDLKDYVKKEDLINKNKYDIDLNLEFGVRGVDDTIIIDMDIADHIINKTINTRGVD